MACEHVFGDPVKMHLTLAPDTCTDSPVGFGPHRHGGRRPVLTSRVL
ncbi:hypothetical protein ACFW93_43075 [Streptomyces canus]